MSVLVSGQPSDQAGSAFSALPADALTGFLNHVLNQQSWAIARLRPHAGKTVQLRLPLTPVVLAIQPDGTLIQTAPEASADVSLIPDPLAWLVAPDAARRFIVGDTEDITLAQEFAEIFSALRWDVEEDLSHGLGDIAAHKLVSAVSGVLSWHRNAADTITRSWIGHGQEENPMLARPEAVRVFFSEVDEMHNRVARLEQKIKQLASTQKNR